MTTRDWLNHVQITMSLYLDAPDCRAITEAVESYKTNPRLMHELPDAEHSRCCLPGRILAEICRDWLDLKGADEEAESLCDSEDYLNEGPR